MQLKEYLFYREVHAAEFADRIGIARQTVGRIVNGKMKSFKYDLVEKIVKETGGEVTYNDLQKEGIGMKPQYPGNK